jgi:septal ring factor EnvC (AmiA/AmiB activator)
MPRLLVIALSIVLTVPAPALAQTTGKDVKQKTGEAAEAIRDYTVERKDQAVAQARKLSSELEAQIKQLETKASRATGEARTTAQKELDEVKQKREQTRKKLAELKGASSASWDAAKQGFVDAYRDLRQAYDRAAGELRK